MRVVVEPWVPAVADASRHIARVGAMLGAGTMSNSLTQRSMGSTKIRPVGQPGLRGWTSEAGSPVWP